jgi:hypothetical protein
LLSLVEQAMTKMEKDKMINALIDCVIYTYKKTDSVIPNAQAVGLVINNFLLLNQFNLQS